MSASTENIRKMEYIISPVLMSYFINTISDTKNAANRRKSILFAFLSKDRIHVRLTMSRPMKTFEEIFMLRITLVMNRIIKGKIKREDLIRKNLMSL
jgi:hypothetical protein